MAAGGYDGVQVWDVKTHRKLHHFGKSGPSLAFSKDGKKLGAASTAETHVWDLATGKELASWKRKYDFYGAMALNPGLAILAQGDYQDIDLCSIGSGKVKGTLSEHRGEVGFLSFSEDGKTLIAASTWFTGPSLKCQGDLKLWDVASHSERISFKGPFGRILQAALSLDGKTLALLDSPELGVIPDIKLIDVATSRQILIPSLPPYTFISLMFTHDGRLFVVGQKVDKSLKLWEVLNPRKG